MGIIVLGNMIVNGDQIFDNGKKIVYQNGERVKEEYTQYEDFPAVTSDTLPVEDSTARDETRKERDFGALIPNDYDKARIITRLHNLIDGKQAIEAVKVLQCAVEGGLITRIPTYSQVKEEFGEICKKSSYYQLTKKPFYDSEKSPIINYLMA